MAFDSGAGMAGATSGGTSGGSSSSGQGSAGGSSQQSSSGGGSGSEGGSFAGREGASGDRSESIGADGQEGQTGEGTAQSEIKKWKIKAEGREHEWTEEEVISHAQKGFSADKKWQEAARKAEGAERTVEYILQQLRENPVAFLKRQELGINPDTLKSAFEGALSEEIEASLDPEGYAQKVKAQKEREELEGYRKKNQTDAQRQKQQEDQQFQQGWDKRVRDHFQQNGKVPLSNFTYNTAINYIDQALRKGYSGVTMDDVMPLVERDWIASHSEIWKLPEDKLLEVIGDEGIKKIQSAVLQRHRKGPPQATQQQVRTEREPQKMMTWEDNHTRALERMKAAGIL